MRHRIPSLGASVIARFERSTNAVSLWKEDVKSMGDIRPFTSYGCCTFRCNGDSGVFRLTRARYPTHGNGGKPAGAVVSTRSIE